MTDLDEAAEAIREGMILYGSSDIFNTMPPHERSLSDMFRLCHGDTDEALRIDSMIQEIGRRREFPRAVG